MDEYWEELYLAIPDDRFEPSAASYLVLNIYQDPKAVNSYHYGRSNVSRDHVRNWAGVNSRPSDPGALRLVFQCLVISTAGYSDYPLNIAREDLFYIANRIGVDGSHISLLFSLYASPTSSKNNNSWYYGSPGIRAICATNPNEAITRAVVCAGEFLQSSLEQVLAGFMQFADHPLMLALAVRATAIYTCEQFTWEKVANLQQAEELTGFDAKYDKQGAEDSNRYRPGSNDKAGQNPSPSQNQLDLGHLSKQVGSHATNLGIFKIIATQLLPLREMMDGDDRIQGNRQTINILEIDKVFESTRKSLLEGIPEYQNRAKGLQTVIFNLIAQQDAQASLLIAQQSRRIALATRNDSTSMKTIAVMTMIFLPATFFAALFAVPTLQWQEDDVVQSRFWVYWAFTIPATMAVLATWYLNVNLQMSKDGRGNEIEEHNGKKDGWKLDGV